MNTSQKIEQEELKILKTEQNKNLDPNGDKWISIDIPTLKKYGVKPFKIMKRKMRKDGEVWREINFENAQKEAERLGYRLPDVRQTIALLEWYKEKNKKISFNDKEFLGIEELSYEEDVCFEWIEGAKSAFIRGGYWDNPSVAGVFALTLDYSPACSPYTDIGFRCVR